MPVRFTCLLMVVRTPIGKLRVQDGYLGDDLHILAERADGPDAMDD